MSALTQSRRRVLAEPPRAARHSHLLRILSGQEVHGGVPDLRERHERQDPEADQHQQPLCFQAHQQPQGDACGGGEAAGAGQAGQTAALLLRLPT